MAEEHPLVTEATLAIACAGRSLLQADAPIARYMSA